MQNPRESPAPSRSAFHRTRASLFLPRPSSRIPSAYKTLESPLHRRESAPQTSPADSTPVPAPRSSPTAQKAYFRQRRSKPFSALAASPAKSQSQIHPL